MQLLSKSEKTMRAFASQKCQSDFDRYALLKDVALLAFHSRIMPEDLKIRATALAARFQEVKFKPEQSDEILALTLASTIIERLAMRSYLSQV